jgi:hypothetical protein
MMDDCGDGQYECSVWHRATPMSQMKILLGLSLIYGAKFMVYKDMGFDIILANRWMCSINCCYQIDHNSNQMWITDNLFEECEEVPVHYLAAIRPVDVNKDIVEQAKSMGIDIIRRVELKNILAVLFERVFLINVHQHGNGNTNTTDKMPGEFQEILKQFQGLFSKQTYSNPLNGMQANFEISTDANGRIPFRSPYRISPHKGEELWKQIDKAIRCG